MRLYTTGLTLFGSLPLCERRKAPRQETYLIAVRHVNILRCVRTRTSPLLSVRDSHTVCTTPECLPRRTRRMTIFPSVCSVAASNVWRCINTPYMHMQCMADVRLHIYVCTLSSAFIFGPCVVISLAMVPIISNLPPRFASV